MKDKKCCENCINFRTCPFCLPDGFRDTCWQRSPDLWLDILPEDAGASFEKTFYFIRIKKESLSAGMKQTIEVKSWNDIVSKSKGYWNGVEFQGPITPKG